MKKLALVILLILCGANRSEATWTYSSVHFVQQSTNSNGFTTSSFNSTTSDFIACSIGWYGPGGRPTIASSPSLTWIFQTNYDTETAGTIQNVTVWAKLSATSASHTITLTGTSDFPAIACALFSGTATSPFDVENGDAAVLGSPLATGSITPSENNELIISGQGTDTFAATSASGLTITDAVAVSAGAAYGVAIAYAIQTTATAINSTWTTSSNSSLAVGIASFKTGSSPPAGIHTLGSLGVGK